MSFKEKGFVPQPEKKNCGQNHVFAKFDVKKPQKPLGF